MKKNITVILALVCSTFLFAQRIKVQSGDFEFLKGQKEVNVEFTYDNLTLYNDNKSNDQYIKIRTAELERKNKGEGVAWAKKWITSRALIYAPKFLDQMNLHLTKKRGVTYGESLVDAKYTLIVEAVWMYPGYNAYAMQQPTKLSTRLKFVETSNRSNVLLDITSKNALGRSFYDSYTNEDRLGESYENTGKYIARLILKKTK